MISTFHILSRGQATVGEEKVGGKWGGVGVFDSGYCFSESNHVLANCMQGQKPLLWS